MKTGLVWFKNDLRLHDNETLTKAIEECDEFIFCYAIEKSNFKKLDLGFRKCDINRFKFLEQSVVDLQNHLEKLGGHLLIGSDSAAQLLPELVKKYDIFRYLCGRRICERRTQPDQKNSKYFA